MALLVTGAAGFIGSNFVRWYLTTHPDAEVIGLDALTYAGNLENLSGLPPDQQARFTFVRADIRDRVAIEDVFRTHPVDGVIHFAAESHVDRSIHDPQVFLTTNVLGTTTLLDALLASRGETSGKGTYIQISTDEVYGSLGPDGLFSETTPLDPHSPYSASKAAADLLVLAYHATYGLPVRITRCSNNYGPYQFPEKLIPLMIQNALRHAPLPVYGDGRQVRDWLYVDDHCRAIDLVYRKGRDGRVYNIGGNNEWENIAIVRLIIRHLSEMTGDRAITGELIRHVTDRPGHDRRYAIDASRIREELGWEPRISFEDGIRATIRWYLDHQDWVAHVISGEYRSFFEKNYSGRIG